MSRWQELQEKRKLKNNSTLDTKNKLSFIDEDEQEEAEDDAEINKHEPKAKRRCFGKNPDVNTLFLSVSAIR